MFVNIIIIGLFTSSIFKKSAGIAKIKHKINEQKILIKPDFNLLAPRFYESYICAVLKHTDLFLYIVQM